MGRIDTLIDTMEDYGFDDLSRSTLARLIDDAHKELCLREAWPFLEKEQSLTQSSNDNTVSTTYALGKVLAFVNTSDKIVLEPLRTDAQLKDFLYDLDVTGSPTHYYFIGEQLYLWPTPSASTSSRIRYLTQPTTLTESSPNENILWPERHDSVLLYSALSKGYYINDDPQGAAMQQVMDARLQVARDDLWMRQYDLPDRIVVLDDNDFLF